MDIPYEVAEYFLTASCGIFLVIHEKQTICRFLLFQVLKVAESKSSVHPGYYVSNVCFCSFLTVFSAFLYLPPASTGLSFVSYVYLFQLQLPFCLKRIRPFLTVSSAYPRLHPRSVPL